MNRKELEQSGKYQLHHTAKARGYVSRKISESDAAAAPYTGRYGTGYTVDLPRQDTTQYITREYWVLVP